MSESGTSSLGSTVCTSDYTPDWSSVASKPRDLRSTASTSTASYSTASSTRGSAVSNPQNSSPCQPYHLHLEKQLTVEPTPLNIARIHRLITIYASQIQLATQNMPPHRDAMELLWRATQCQSWTGQLEWMQDAERVWLKDERRKRKEEMAEIARLNKKARLEDVLKFENHSEMFKGMMIAVKRRVLS